MKHHGELIDMQIHGEDRKVLVEVVRVFRHKGTEKMTCRVAENPRHVNLTLGQRVTAAFLTADDDYPTLVRLQTKKRKDIEREASTQRQNLAAELQEAMTGNQLRASVRIKGLV